jgi:hypothetical protein
MSFFYWFSAAFVLDQPRCGFHWFSGWVRMGGCRLLHLLGVRGDQYWMNSSVSLNYYCVAGFVPGYPVHPFGFVYLHHCEDAGCCFLHLQSDRSFPRLGVHVFLLRRRNWIVILFDCCGIDRYCCWQM